MTIKTIFHYGHNCAALADLRRAEDKLERIEAMIAHRLDHNMTAFGTLKHIETILKEG